MWKIEKAIEKIRTVECPTGELKNRIADILDDFNVANRNDIQINRNEAFDRDGAEAYVAGLRDDMNRSLVVLSKPGLDDYVARVVDAYQMK
ncbi:MAG: hypothetical protein AAGU76_02300 [Sedimentibacter sp.]|uniref:hypothetical protein n=1 Tax=Sedimentibacter sp. TaxID=1960295 RepID=UPI003159654F